MTETPSARTWGLRAFGIYLAGALLLGEVFPFSRFSMYAGIAQRTAAAIPLFLADGEPASPEDYKGFSGIDPGGLGAPEGLVSTMDYVVKDTARWIEAHPGEPGGPVAITLGWRIVTPGPGGLIEERRVLEEGTAWPR